MPVSDNIFTPRGQLVTAETVVDMVSMHNLITDQRTQVEQAATPAARRVAYTTVEFRIPTAHTVNDLAARLEAALERTLRYGYRSARREVQTLRLQQPVVAVELPDVGRYARLAQLGLPGIRQLIRRRTGQAAGNVAAAVTAAATTALAQAKDETATIIAVTTAATRSLHNQVLELVGEVLNLGRTAGVLEMREPPTFSMRSEQLDKGTCQACAMLHGAIVEVGSPSYFEYLPPAGCYGGGRCRGFMVFADSISQVRGPEPEHRGPQPDLSPIPPVRFPERRAA